MHLRNVLLFFSVLMIGFCLMLYFQSDGPLQSTMSFDQYRLHDHNRSHSLEEFNKKIHPVKIQDVISEIHSRNKLAGEKTRVMHVGVYDGKTLMEIRKLFPDVELYGIAVEKRHDFYRRESFIMTALKYNLATKAEIDRMELPYLLFKDLDFGQRIPYDENKFDLIFSQDTIPTIRYTFELFNEILRVLKKGGLSVHSDVTGVNIYSNGVVIDFKEAMKEFRKKGIEFQVLERPTSIKFKKPDHITPFPVLPHIPVPTNFESLTQEQRWPEMNYNLVP